jgi:hypothetical protein
MDFSSANLKKLVKFPVTFFLEKPSDFDQWVTNTQKGAEIALGTTHRTTIKVGGQIFQELGPNHPIVLKCRETQQNSYGPHTTQIQQIQQVQQTQQNIQTPQKHSSSTPTQVGSGKKTPPPPPPLPSSSSSSFSSSSSSSCCSSCCSSSQFISSISSPFLPGGVGKIDFFPSPDPQFSQRGVLDEVSARVLGLDPVIQSRTFSEEKFVDLQSREFEDSKLLDLRRELWFWVVKSLTGTNPDKPLVCSHIVGQTDRYDVTHLIRNVREFLGTQNFSEFSETLETFYTIKYRRGESLFHFFTRVQESVHKVQILEHLSERVGEPVKIPNWQVTLKMLTAVKESGEYSHWIYEIFKKQPVEYLRITPKEIWDQLQQLYISDRQLSSTPITPTLFLGENTQTGAGGSKGGPGFVPSQSGKTPPLPPTLSNTLHKFSPLLPRQSLSPSFQHTLNPNSTPVVSNTQQKQIKTLIPPPEKHLCMFKYNNGECKKVNCKYDHNFTHTLVSVSDSENKNKKGGEKKEKEKKNSSSSSSSSSSCVTCGDPNHTKCGWKGSCHICENNHKTQYCKKRAFLGKVEIVPAE